MYVTSDLVHLLSQPRRVAAIAMAQRVAFELNTKMGDTVAYQVRYDSTVSARCRIKFMTDGVLLREVCLYIIGIHLQVDIHINIYLSG